MYLSIFSVALHQGAKGLKEACAVLKEYGALDAHDAVWQGVTKIGIRGAPVLRLSREQGQQGTTTILRENIVIRTKYA